MKLTIKQLKDIISDYNDIQELDFIGLEDIVITTKTSILVPKKEIEEHPKKGLGNDIFCTESIPNRIILPNEIMELLEWKDDKSTRVKLEAFANTLISIWNPNTGLLRLDHKKLNNTTLSRALFITKTQGKKINPKDKEFNIDEIINNVILYNLPYLKKKYCNQ